MPNNPVFMELIINGDPEHPSEWFRNDYRKRYDTYRKWCEQDGVCGDMPYPLNYF